MHQDLAWTARKTVDLIRSCYVQSDISHPPKSWKLSPRLTPEIGAGMSNVVTNDKG